MEFYRSEHLRDTAMKHLIYLIDGTWQFAGEIAPNGKFTNLYKLNNCLKYMDEASRPQFVHYSRGVGSGRRLERLMGGAFAYGIWNDIADIYANLASNYVAGDRIYLFGFSRGAIVARVVAGLLDHGLLKSDELDFMNHVISAYRITASELRRRPLDPFLRMFPTKRGKSDLDSHKKSLAGKVIENVEVEFMGLFDSVIGGNGLSQSIQELNVDRSHPARSVKKVVHILSVDESRYHFQPSPFLSQAPERDPNSIEQIWFPGVHADIGGGYMIDELSNWALLLMIDRILTNTDLQFFKNKVDELIVFDKKQALVNSEYSGLLGMAYSQIGRKRTCEGIARTVHPMVDELGKINTHYKGKSLGNYTVHTSFESCGRTQPFTSEEMQGKWEKIFPTHPS